MKFDTIIIGGGLAGLTCGIKLAQNNQRCAIVTSGQSSLYFFSGSLDLLGYYSKDEPVYAPLEVITELIDDIPAHPYSKLGLSKIETFSNESIALLKAAGLNMQGDIHKNHFRISPIGLLKPTWLTLSDMAVSALDNQLPWKKIAVCNLAGFMDFSHQLVVEEFRSVGLEVDLQLLNIRFLDALKQNSTEVRATGIAQLLEREENLIELANAINGFGKNYDIILLPAIFDLADGQFERLKNMVININLAVLPTMPPSVPGIAIETMLIAYFKKLGGTFFLGDSVLKGETTDGKVLRVFSKNHEDIPFVADNYVLATGSFFSKGLVATNTSVYEPVFGSDVKYLSDRTQWYAKDLFGRQNYFEFGVETTNDFNVLISGKPVRNLYAIGSILSDFHPVQECSGGGVAMFTALDVANSILRYLK